MAVGARKGSALSPSAKVGRQHAHARLTHELSGHGPKGHVRAGDTVDGEDDGVGLGRWRARIRDTQRAAPDTDLAEGVEWFAPRGLARAHGAIAHPSIHLGPPLYGRFRCPPFDAVVRPVSDARAVNRPVLEP